MKPGEVWVACASGYASKPRPVVVVQEQDLPYESTVVCLITSHDSSGMPARVLLEPTPENGLRARSYLMVDKPMTLSRSQLQRRIGHLDEAATGHVRQALAELFGLA